ncbi:MAG: hypothetical protein A2139_08030 [Desulfobacca sp. RBG_16_60_12]|nr:MAG: hypothetical protein A2139_08030 [Desulfobacca sp. RBG_16_60_12]
MNLKNFFSLNEMAMFEMAGMPKDSPYNGFLYKQLMAKYGNTYQPGRSSAWPKGVSALQQAEDVVEWHNQAAEQDIFPSGEVTPRKVVSALNWPFALGSGFRSPNAAKNMRALAVEVGFATQEDMDDLVKREQEKEAAGKKTSEMPKMSSTVRTVDPKAPLARPPTKVSTTAAPPAADDEDFFSGS